MENLRTSKHHKNSKIQRTQKLARIKELRNIKRNKTKARTRKEKDMIENIDLHANAYTIPFEWIQKEKESIASNRARRFTKYGRA